MQTKRSQYQHISYLWDGNRQAQEQTNTHVFTTIYEQDSFAPVARLVWLKDSLIVSANDEPETDEGWYGNNKPEPPPKIQVYHYHNDQLGTPNELTNQQGEVVWLADYEAWGNTAKIVWREESLSSIKVSADELQPIRFQGQYFDEETGLHYNRFRYYDPDLGMFVSSDPIGLIGGFNTFQYAPNPTGWIDPLGLIKVYRALTNSQGYQAKFNLPITPTNLNARFSMQQHVEDGKLSTQFISTSKAKKRVVDLYAKPNPAKGKPCSSYVVEIDTDQLSSKQVFDISSGINPETGKAFIGKAYNFSRIDKEVLIKGVIPKYAYRIIEVPKC